ncbi:MAG TPA: GFA family protein [Myxococcota bacterium]|nr:GFA family protein [Myxococcota bacterium]
MLEGSCDCGAVRIELDVAPKDVTDCNCGICRRCGARWSYFHPMSVRILPPSGATAIYQRGKRMLEFHRCTMCGCVTHWAPVDKRHPRMGVNMRLFPPELLAKLEVLLCDAASW